MHNLTGVINSIVKVQLHIVLKIELGNFRDFLIVTVLATEWLFPNYRNNINPMRINLLNEMAHSMQNWRGTT